MSIAIDRRIEAFAAPFKDRGVPIGPEGNKSRRRTFEEKLPKRLPPSFCSLLSRYWFPAFDVLGISLLGWDSDSNPHSAEASAARGSLFESLLPAG
jgi:hypothetical protein